MLKILLPTDFSSTADNALRYALNFADRVSARLVVLHVYEPPQIRTMTLPYTMEEIYQSMEVEAFENFQDYIPHLKEIAEKEGLAHVPMTHLVFKGDVKNMIADTIEKEDVDMLIMGTQGAGIIKQFFFGNQTAYMMENSPIPVLAIPPNIPPDRPLDSVVLTTNYKKVDNMAMDFLIKWAEKLKFKLYSIHINLNDGGEQIALGKEWDNKYSRRGVSCFIRKAEDFLLGIDSFRNEKDTKVIAMVTRSRNFIHELFNKNLAKEIIYSKTTALLAIPETMLHKIRT